MFRQCCIDRARHVRHGEYERKKIRHIQRQSRTICTIRALVRNSGVHSERQQCLADIGEGRFIARRICRNVEIIASNIDFACVCFLSRDNVVS